MSDLTVRSRTEAQLAIAKAELMRIATASDVPQYLRLECQGALARIADIEKTRPKVGAS